MQQRRVFLSVLSGSVGAAVVGGGCGGNGGSGVGGFGGGSGGAGGDGAGTGGTTASDTSTVSSSASQASSTSVSSSASSSSSGGNCTANPSGTNAGPTSKFMTPGLHQVTSTSQFLVGYDAKGFYAVSSLCTHEFCNMNKTSKGSIIQSGVHCKCHGSNFDQDGNVTQGPANQPLDNFKVEIGCDMNVYVDTNKIVAMGTRVMP